ncbi:hypothetical protein D3C81_1431400 [compost metagenome]
MRQFTHRRCRDADFPGHAFNVTDRSTHHFPRLHRFVAGGLRCERRIAGVLRDVLHGQAHFVNRGGDHVGHFLLTTRALGGVIHHPRHLADSRAQAFTGGQHFADHVALAVEESIEATGQITQLIGAAGI